MGQKQALNTHADVSSGARSKFWSHTLCSCAGNVIIAIIIPPKYSVGREPGNIVQCYLALLPWQAKLPFDINTRGECSCNFCHMLFTFTKTAESGNNSGLIQTSSANSVESDLKCTSRVYFDNVIMTS